MAIEKARSRIAIAVNLIKETVASSGGVVLGVAFYSVYSQSDPLVPVVIGATVELGLISGRIAMIALRSIVFAHAEDPVSRN